jgi:hypothetical protein
MGKTLLLLGLGVSLCLGTLGTAAVLRPDEVFPLLP